VILRDCCPEGVQVDNHLQQQQQQPCIVISTSSTSKVLCDFCPESYMFKAMIVATLLRMAELRCCCSCQLCWANAHTTATVSTFAPPQHKCNQDCSNSSSNRKRNIKMLCTEQLCLPPPRTTSMVLMSCCLIAAMCSALLRMARMPP
jgi:hypothetical protein